MQTIQDYFFFITLNRRVQRFNNILICFPKSCLPLHEQIRFWAHFSRRKSKVGFAVWSVVLLTTITLWLSKSMRKSYETLITIQAYSAAPCCLCLVKNYHLVFVIVSLFLEATKYNIWCASRFEFEHKVGYG